MLLWLKFYPYLCSVLLLLQPPNVQKIWEVDKKT